jgi:hypothetical protein
LGEIKQFFLDLIGKFHEKSFFRVFSKSCLLKSEKYSSRSSQSIRLFNDNSRGIARFTNEVKKAAV